MSTSASNRARRESTAERTAQSGAAASASDAIVAAAVGPGEEEELSSPAPRRSPRLERTSSVAGEETRTHKAVKQTGLTSFLASGSNAGTSASAFAKKKKAPKRLEGAWQYVSVHENDEDRPVAECNFCGQTFRVQSVTRVIDHILGRAGAKMCTAESDEYLAAVQSLKAEESAKNERKDRKRKLSQATARADSKAGGQPSSVPAANIDTAQTPLVFNRGTQSDADDAVARFFFGNNIPVSVVESQHFRNLVKVVRTAPLDWVPPNRRKLGGPCLLNLVKTLRQEEAPLRATVMRSCATVLSDGWDCIDRSHLINQLVGTSDGIFFDGTVQLGADDHEDSSFLASVFSALINRTGLFSVVHLVSDTCSTMKAAWRKIEAEYPWITTTPCGTHVLNLELKDLGKLPAFQKVIQQCKAILKIFWGRTRWPRLKLKETIRKNHEGATWGLYRAKATRFAGNVKEMARILRAKASLQEVVVSAEYCKRMKDLDHKANLPFFDGAGDDGVTTTAEQVRTILLDEAHFWEPLVNALQCTHPIVTLLRLMDANKPCLGKVYYHMCHIAERMHKLKAAGICCEWIDEAIKIHSARWEYLHSPFHAAAYALDPEFFETVGDIDDACQVTTLACPYLPTTTLPLSWHATFESLVASEWHS